MMSGAENSVAAAPPRWDPRALLASLDERSRRAAFENSRLLLVQKNLLISLCAVPLLALLTGWLMQVWVPLTTAVLWAGAFIATSTIAILLIRRFRADCVDPDAVTRKLTLCGALVSFAVLPWAALPLLFWKSGGEELRFVLILLEAAAIPYAMATSSASQRVFLLHSLPFVFAFLVPPILEGGTIYHAIAGLGCIYVPVMYGIGYQLHAFLTSMFYAREENALLLEQVAHAKAESDTARLRAERLNQAKSTFLANMSHELRTPLNAVLGFAEVIKTEMLGPVGTPVYREYAADIYDSGKHLLGLINDILDLSRIEAGRLDLTPTVVALDDLIDGASRFLHHNAARAGITITKRCAPGLPALLVDERAFRQVLLNLLGNAIKFTPRDGSITIHAQTGSSVHGSDGLSITVADTGIGIKKEDLSIVLEAFGQAHVDDLAMTTPREQGTGLGLPIVRGLLQAHGATFELKSEFGRGTSAILHLPQSCLVEPAERQIGSRHAAG
jgi:two-component system cell cycle sensor histidine kinase PleC